ncbi:MAG: hypothetical protein LAN70_10460 [Acidobacteriia bacterium]|nr:hypothetical protein [Terriglobia bacterium]
MPDSGEPVTGDNTHSRSHYFSSALGPASGLVRRGVVEPQREVLRRLCPQFREMNPWAECAPCGNCKTQLCDLLAEHAPWEKNRILCGGLAELVANAITAVQPGFLQWERGKRFEIARGL